ncbi:TonB-dependent receptor domain-containing protein [Algoriphagus resistens]|uniref:TonB-dependent receptor domain-containing protein n=1 Tax=Algoriphagus resistens TaxID=1750590 RepID=UPI000716C70E|nr:TonB-dependent receptor [Algoriphagus resistens]
MTLRLLTFITLFVFFHERACLAQTTAKTHRGRVLIKGSEAPLEFATIKFLSAATGLMETGTTSTSEGYFELQSALDSVVVEISFIGFTTVKKPMSLVNGGSDLGIFYLEEESQGLDEVVIRAEKSQTQYELDKRIFNVGNDLVSTGASALDVLNNVPSVYVNIKGEISLRGSSGVRVLINGKPSVLAQGNTLGTLTADMIERIEVITNPSAKYEAEGTSGIINIVIKKDQRQGVNGSVTLNTGVPNNHSLGFSLNRRTERLNLFTQIGIGHRTFPEEYKSENKDLAQMTSVLSSGKSEMHERYYTINLGGDYRVSESGTLSVSGRYAFEAEEGDSKTRFKSLNPDGQPLSEWERTELTEAPNPKWQYEAVYKNLFKSKIFSDSDSKSKEHSLIVSATSDYFAKDQVSNYSNDFISGETVTTQQETLSDNTQQEYTFKADYTNPLSSKTTLESGAQYVLTSVSNDYAVNDLIGGEWITDLDLSNLFDYRQNVLGVYTTVSYEVDKVGIKGGLRVENTTVDTELTTTGQKNSQAYTDLFPSIHGAYKFHPDLSLQLGYSRRILRPSVWDLNPFFSIQNNFNIYSGNPDLQPEYTDALELTSIYDFGAFSVNGSLYYRYTTNAVENITTFSENVATTMPANIGTSKSGGLEFNAKYMPNDWLSVNGDFNFGWVRKFGTFEESAFDFNADQWTSRITSKFNLPADFSLELIGHFNSRQQTLQGTVSQNVFADLGIRKKLMKGRAIVNLSVRDVFASRIYEVNTLQPGFTNYAWEKDGRFVTLGVSFGFGKGEAMEFSGQKAF